MVTHTWVIKTELLDSVIILQLVPAGLKVLNSYCINYIVAVAMIIIVKLLSIDTSISDISTQNLNFSFTFAFWHLQTHHRSIEVRLQFIQWWNGQHILDKFKVSFTWVMWSKIIHYILEYPCMAAC